MSKNKGNSYERSVAVQLSLWWTQGENDAVFWRTDNSGGRATTRRKKGLKTINSYGDICTIDPIGEPLLKLMCIEIKRGYGRATLHDLIDQPEKSKKPIYLEWIEKAERDRLAAGSFYWILIHKRDRREAVVTMPRELLSYLVDEGVQIDDGVQIDLDTILCCDLLGNLWISSIKLEDLLKSASKEHVIAVLGKMASYELSNAV